MQPIAEHPQLTKVQGHRDGQEGELDARLLAPLCSSAVRRFRKLAHIAGGVHVGKDDLDVGAGDQGIMFGYAGDGTCKTKIRSLMIGLDAGSETTIFNELKLGDVVTTIPTIGSGVGDCGVEELELHRVGRGRPGQDSRTMASFVPGYGRSDLHCQQQRSKQGRGRK